MKPALFVARVSRPDSQFLGLYVTGRGFWAESPSGAAKATIAEWGRWLEDAERRLRQYPAEETADLRFADGIALEPAP